MNPFSMNGWGSVDDPHRHIPPSDPRWTHRPF